MGPWRCGKRKRCAGQTCEELRPARGGELASGAHPQAPWGPASSVSEAHEARRKSCGSWNILPCPTPPGPTCIAHVSGVGLSRDGRLGGSGRVLVDAAAGLDRMAVSALPLSCPSWTAQPPQPQTLEAPLLSHCVWPSMPHECFWDPLEASVGPDLGSCLMGTTVYRKLNREQVATPKSLTAAALSATTWRATITLHRREDSAQDRGGQGLCGGHRQSPEAPAGVCGDRGPNAQVGGSHRSRARTPKPRQFETQDLGSVGCRCGPR